MKETELRSIKGKYSKIYFQILDKRRTNPVSREVYSEEHHVVPASLGGSDRKENLVRITAREHFICHYLLVRMITAKRDYKKMVHAFISMAASPKGSGARYMNSRLYANYREAFGKLMQVSQTGEGNSCFGTVWVSHPQTKEIQKIKEVELKSKVLGGWLVGRVSKWKVRTVRDSVLAAYRKTYALLDKPFEIDQVIALVGLDEKGPIARRYLRSPIRTKTGEPKQRKCGPIMEVPADIELLKQDNVAQRRANALAIVAKIKTSGATSLDQYVCRTDYRQSLVNLTYTLRSGLNPEEYVELKAYLKEKKRELKILDNEGELSPHTNVCLEHRIKAHQILDSLASGTCYCIKEYAEQNKLTEHHNTLNRFLLRNAEPEKYQTIIQILRGRAVLRRKASGGYQNSANRGQRAYKAMFTVQQQREIGFSSLGSTALAAKFNVSRNVIRGIKADAKNGLL